MRDPSHRTPWPGAVARRIDLVASRLTNRLIRATPRRTVAVPTTEPVVSFTFDDVPASSLTAGATILERSGARGTFYIAGGLEGRIEADRVLIDSAGCRELAERGHEIGCHTYAHENLRGLRPSALAADLSRNARYLDAVDPRPGRRNFAFPYNAGSFKHRRRLDAAFRTCRAGGEGINRGPTDPGFLRAVEIRQPEEHAAGLTRWLDELVRRPGWLIFFTHDIAPAPTPFGCRPETLRLLVESAVAAGCRVLTVDAALDRMGLREDPR